MVIGFCSRSVPRPGLRPHGGQAAGGAQTLRDSP